MNALMPEVERECASVSTTYPLPWDSWRVTLPPEAQKCARVSWLWVYADYPRCARCGSIDRYCWGCSSAPVPRCLPASLVGEDCGGGE